MFSLHPYFFRVVVESKTLLVRELGTIRAHPGPAEVNMLMCFLR
jgi:hypothetical protein